jgi:predicted P-loop ATPase
VLIAGVRRVRSPGCKFDYILVLEGKQGVGKSSLLKILAGEDNFSDNEIIGLNKKEQQEAIQGIWIYELAELEGLHKSDVTKVKLFASKTMDMARPAYGRSRVDRPRRCIIVATTNEDTYLRDTTGNRRFWPVWINGVVPCGDDKMLIDFEAVARDRDQLWAEAAAMEARGESLVIPEALWPDAAAAQAAREELDPWEDLLAGVLANLSRKERGLGVSGKFEFAGGNIPEWRVSTEYLLTEVLDLPKERQHNTHTKRLASVMRALGWERPSEPVRIGRVKVRGFVKSKVKGSLYRDSGPGQVEHVSRTNERPPSLQYPNQSFYSNVPPVPPVPLDKVEILPPEKPFRRRV